MTEKITFPSGAQRGTDCTTGYYMLSQIALRRYADAMAEGAIKYNPHNWLKGIPAENLIDHMQNHIAKFLQGDSSEDHLGHALWNLASLIHFSETRHDLFDGLPPGVKDGMLEWLATYDIEIPNTSQAHSTACSADAPPEFTDKDIEEGDLLYWNGSKYVKRTNFSYQKGTP